MSNTIQQVPAAQIIAGLNDRETFNRSELEALAVNIAANGLLQPPVYRPVGDNRYQIIAGERRTRAMRDILAWPLIPAIVTTMDDEAAIAAMGSENRCRVQLNPIEEAKGYAGGMARFGWDLATCASKNGVRVPVVRERLALLDLCPEAQDMVAKGQLRLKYALILAQRTVDGAVALDYNFQVQALRLLTANKSPNLEWWGSIITELIGECRQNSLFDMADFMIAKEAEIQAPAVDTLPPDPDTDDAPNVGTTQPAVMAYQIHYWQDAADAWGKLYASTKRAEYKAKRQGCLNTARGLALANKALLALDAAQMAMAQPVVASMAPSPSEPPMAPSLDVPADVLVEAITGRAGRVVCTCGRRATHKIAYKEASADGLGRRLVVKTVCNAHLPDGVAPLVAGPAEQLTFGIAA